MQKKVNINSYYRAIKTVRNVAGAYSAALGFSLLLPLSSSAVWADQASESKPEVSVSSLKGELYLLRGKGGNVVLSKGDDGLLLIDSDYGKVAPAYRDAIKTLVDENAEEKTAEKSTSPRFLINTHWHGDHTGGNAYWGESGTIIVAQTNVRTRLKAKNEENGAAQATNLPMITYENSSALHFNGEDIQLQYYPAGHTDSDTVVFFANQNVIHMGDLFFNGRFPYVDTGSGGDVNSYIANIITLLDLVDDDAIIVPGHGAVANKADLQSYLDMLLETTKAIKSALDDGKTAEEVVSQGLGEKWNSWGQGFISEEKWINTVVASAK